MIVQFLNGTQYHTSSPYDAVFYEIYHKAKELHLEIVVPEQICLINSTSQLYYGFIKDISELPYTTVENSIFFTYSKEDRIKVFDSYIQSLADKKFLRFIRDVDEDLVYNKRSGTFVSIVCRHNSPIKETPTFLEDGRLVYSHWFAPGGYSSLHEATLIVDSNDVYDFHHRNQG